jgi:hypothetical protein
MSLFYFIIVSFDCLCVYVFFKKEELIKHLINIKQFLIINTKYFKYYHSKKTQYFYLFFFDK